MSIAANMTTNYKITQKLIGHYANSSVVREGSALINLWPVLDIPLDPAIYCFLIIPRNYIELLLLTFLYLVPVLKQDTHGKNNCSYCHAS